MKNLRLLLLLTLPIVVLSCPAFSQSKPNSLYIEIFGSGGLYSLNYDRLFTENIGARIGFMYFAADWLGFFSDLEMFLIPSTLNFFIGTGKHKLELGAGPVIIFGSTGIFGSDQVSGSGVAWTGRIGYRYQQPNGGFMWKIGFTPLFGNGVFQPWDGISLGFSF